jgi:plasmid stabilization system protein ParE
MKCRVRWSRIAEDELTRLWLNAADRAAINAAAQSIDVRRAADAPNEGESRSSGFRILFASPLAATYRVDANGRDVYVAHIWRYRIG